MELQQGNVSDLSGKDASETPALTPPPPPPARKLLCLRLKWWYAGHFLTNLLLIILIIACLATPKWVKTGSDDMDIQGGLLTCSDCDAPFEDLSYKEAADAEECDTLIPDYTGYCMMFKELKEAGGAFLFFDLITLIFLLFWTVKLFFLYKGAQVLQKPPWLFYVISAVAGSAHILALIIWGGVTSAAFNADCADWEPDGSLPALCSTDGPAIAIAVLVILLINVVAYWVVQFKSSGSARLPEQGRFQPAEAPARDFSHAINLEIPSSL
jgi:hypothetical protein